MLDSPTIAKKRANFVPRPYPQVIKYMGSKAGIIDFVVDGINSVHSYGRVCDLFAGACTLSGSLGGQVPILSNDIQSYSGIISQVYLHRLTPRASDLDVDELIEKASLSVRDTLARLPEGLSYPVKCSLDEFNLIEERNRQLIEAYFSGPYHLFLQSYSGTWWSAEQCAWIDALRSVIDGLLEADEIEIGDHAFMLTCVMHAMAYTSQGTGHYAQYRDAKTDSSMADINIYRQKSLPDYFVRKFNTMRRWNLDNVTGEFTHEATAMDYVQCLAKLNADTVYADPPYAFVHYSRFYHAIETFVRYDYPALQVKAGSVVKGRYREDRHQSPFSIRSQVGDAFRRLFEGVAATKSQLVLSYSDTALLDLSTLVAMAKQSFGAGYEITVLSRDHRHMTMGRREDRNRDVKEALILASR